MRSLADSLTADAPSFELPTQPAQPADDYAGMTGTQFAKAVLESSEFRQYIIKGLSTRDIPAAILTKLMDHGWGKPLEKLEVKTTTGSDLDSLSLPELRARLTERIAFLQELTQLAEDTQGSVH